MYENYIIFVIYTVFLTSSYSVDCGILTRSASQHGFGLFAGREWGLSSEILEVTIGIPVRLNAVFGNYLINYVEGLNSTHVLLTLGQSMMINHVEDHNRENIRKINSPFKALYRFRTTGSYSLDVAYELRGYVSKGEEFLTDYGVEGWFADRSLTYSEPYDILYSNAFDGCPSEFTYIYEQSLYARTNISKYATIELSRAILLPITDKLVEAGPLVEFLWWPYRMRTITRAETSLLDLEFMFAQYGGYYVQPYNMSYSYAVLLSGRGSLYAVSNADQGIIPNVHYTWQDLSNDCHDSDMTCSDGGRARECSLLTAVSFTALRDIHAGEKLVVDLVEDPLTHFRYATAEFSQFCMGKGAANIGLSA